MGNFNLSIRGIGTHHNADLKTDVDRMARRFVRELEEAGHRISGAELTYGGAETYASEQVGVTAGREDRDRPPLGAIASAAVTLLLSILLGAVMFLPSLALAQAAVIADPSVDFGAAVNQFVVAIQHGKYGEAVSLGLMLVIFGLRVLAKRLPESGLSKALTSKLGGWVLNFTVSVVGAVASALATSQPITLVLIVSALTNALAASGTWELIKDLMVTQPKLTAVETAREEASTGVDTKAKALEVLRGPPAS